VTRLTPALVSCWWATVVLCAAAIPAAAQESTPPNASETQTAPVAAAGVGANYRLTEEDVLRVEVYNEQQLSNPQVQITPDGKINIAYIGEVQAAGLTQAELAQSIAKKLEEAGILANAKIQITVLAVHRPTCRVGGAVRRPGEVTFKDGDTIMDAIAQAGSYEENAWLENAVLTRKGTSIPINLRKLYNEGDLSQNYELQKGDIIYIPPMTYENQIYVLGYVMRPGIYPYKENTTALAAISLAGGPNERGSVRGTRVARGDPAKPQLITCNLAKVLDSGDITQDVVLKPGDVVYVPETKKPDWRRISEILSTLINIGYVRRYGMF